MTESVTDVVHIHDMYTLSSSQLRREDVEGETKGRDVWKFSLGWVLPKGGKQTQDGVSESFWIISSSNDRVRVWQAASFLVGSDTPALCRPPVQANFVRFGVVLRASVCTMRRMSEWKKA